MTLTVKEWVDEMSRTTNPDHIHWCDGSDAENDLLIDKMTADGTLLRLNESWPNSFLHRSNPTDVSRSEGCTFICSEEEIDAGPTNNWLSPADAQERIWPLFKDCMRGRTMYVVPYIMGPIDSPQSKVGVEITDSPYVVANMRIMTRMGQVALDRLADGKTEWSPGLHSIGDLSPDHRFIAHFPETRTVWSIGSGYGGNALLGKKCLALRIASVMGEEQGWLAEHMMILGLESPDGDITYIAGAFPSACGKTNLAMLRSPFEAEGWRVWTVGDDIAWLHVGPDGRLWAMNPEKGYFGVAPGTNRSTNPNALVAASRNTIFTNVAETPDGGVWWEGMDGPVPPHLTDWKGHPWTPESGTKAAHPNSRFTAPAVQNPAISSHWEDPLGVPLSAILLGGRRAHTIPLVCQSFDWEHGVFLGATMTSETTAAAVGKVGVLRRDPMAMLPFCGYNMGDYWAHWLDMGARMSNPPAIFQVNWFRTDDDGKYLWPGFGENMRVLRWVRNQVQAQHASADARETVLGFMPTYAAIGAHDLGLSEAEFDELFAIDPAEWLHEVEDQAVFLDRFGDRLPPAIAKQREELKRRLLGLAQAPLAA